MGLVPLANFLYPPAGVAFLQQQTQPFRPLMARGRDVSVEGLRAAILHAAKGGPISAMAILRQRALAGGFRACAAARAPAYPCDFLALLLRFPSRSVWIQPVAGLPCAWCISSGPEP
ncbi:hypothetical protein [Synechococcus sp. HK01-R]|uniref:hypothetical protein n=1 Tax=Synechococcus sp. HK01-R TaxID=2751171 RepID=UPI0016241BBC|nr:hypothetical protein [Synechococcus sp. HK01-R]QNG27117.1 hypothetical protein H0O21_00060 [Synechococcus sp. HK01-R]